MSRTGAANKAASLNRDEMLCVITWSNSPKGCEVFLAGKSNHWQYDDFVQAQLQTLGSQPRCQPCQAIK